mgnify:CR=1 FL=1
MAYKNYIQKNNKQASRFVDHNMNRIWNQEHLISSYEHKRKNELLQIFDEIDIAIDLHSVSQGNSVMLISDFQHKHIVSKLFDVEYVLFDNIGNT